MPLTLTFDVVVGSDVLCILVTENGIFSQTFGPFILRFTLWSNQSRTRFGLTGYDESLTETQE